MRAAMRFILNRLARRVPVLLPLLKTLYEADLTFHKGLAALRQVYEHGVELAADGGLAGRQPQHFPAHLVEGARNLAYLVRGINIDRFQVGRSALAVVLSDAANQVGQLDP